MQVILEIIEGPLSGEQIIVVPGQTVQVGRTERADFACADDLEMSSVHFDVTCEDTGCVVRDLESTNGTFVNGQRISATLLEQGDQVRAGRSVFLVHLQQGATSAAKPSGSVARSRDGSTIAPPAAGAAVRTEFFQKTPSESGALSGDSAFVAATAAEICQKCELDDAAREHLQENNSPRQFVEALMQTGLTLDALRFLSHALPKRAGVWWAQECVQLGYGNQLTAQEEAALQAARHWVIDPSDEHRRAAHQAAEALEFGAAAAWVALAAFWASGSMAPPESPEVPPAESNTGKAIGGSVIMASVAHQPEHAADKQKSFIQRALDIAGGEPPWK